jgi:MFS transporter, OFA family, oxalate/formate antiporter
MNRPRWFPGYTVAGVSALAFFATAPGQTFIISQFNTALRDAFEISEWSLNSAYAIATIAAALPLVLIGRYTDAIGPRRMMALVALLFGSGCMFMGSATGPMMVFAGFFLLRFLGQGALSLVSQHALAMWFHRRLGWVHGMMQVAVFGLWVALPQVVVRMIDSVGWRETYMILGASIWILVIPPALLLLRNRPEELGLRMDGDPPDAEPGPLRAIAAGGHPEQREPTLTLRHAVRTRAYWTLAAVFFLSPLIGTALLFEMQPLLLARGMTLADAAIAVSAWTATMGLMALPAGFLTDRLRPGRLLAAGMGLIGLGAILIMLAWQPLVAAAATVALGAGHSVTATCSSATLARYFGRAHHGAIRSSTMRIGVIGTGLGPVVTGLSVRYAGGYNTAMLTMAAMCVPVLILCLWLRPPRQA